MKWIAGRKETQIEGLPPCASRNYLIDKKFWAGLDPCQGGVGQHGGTPVTEPSLFRNGPGSMSMDARRYV